MVVATEKEDVYQEISGILNSVGLMEFRDYIPVQMVQKKLVVMYGNCHMMILEKYLLKQREFQRQYVIRRYYIAETDKRKRYPSNNVLAHCQVLITQDIQRNNNLRVPGAKDVIRNTPADCKNIVIPNLYGFNFFFPQVHLMDENVFERHINKNAIDIDIDIDRPQNCHTKYVLTWIIGWRDENIESAFKSGGDNQVIQEMINKREVYCREEIVHNFRNQLARLKQREQECDIKICDFIEENYKTKQLFYDPNHPSNELIYEKGKRILKLLHLDIQNDIVINDALDDGELFIYGCVKDALGIVYEQKYIKHHRYSCTLHNHAISLSDYIDEYLAWYFGQ